MTAAKIDRSSGTCSRPFGRFMQPLPWFVLALLGIGLSIRVENPLGAKELIELLADPGRADSFDAYYYAYGTLPRLAAALLGGAILGLTGALLQQLTQNPMTSPMTLGTSAGAWLAIVLASAFAPALTGDGLAFAAFAGGLTGFGLIAAIAGPRGMTGSALVIAGMVVNLLFGAVAAAVLLLKSDFVSNIFLWGAGDLAQNGRDGVSWLAWRTIPVMAILIAFAPRLLALLSLGEEGARARGLAVQPVFVALAFLGVWLACSFVTLAGVINFTGLIAPNIARSLGWRSPRSQLVASAFIGSALLCATDGFAVLLGALTESIVPTGVIAALLGTPVFIAYLLRPQTGLRENPQECIGIDRTVHKSAMRASAKGSDAFSGLVRVLWPIATVLALVAGLTLFLNASTEGWRWGAASEQALALRLPRLATALFAGASLAAAGVILRRLVGNPLASPDILGVTSGATFAVVAAATFCGAGVGSDAGSSVLWALTGSLAVLGAILVLAKRTHFSPVLVIVLGIAVSALFDAFTALMLSRGTMDNYFILQWLSGSTYKATSESAERLALAFAILAALAFALSRSLTLLSIGRDFAASRGLSVKGMTAILLLLCALLCASATATMGPVAFVGLVAPHLAVLLGARTCTEELVTAALAGAALTASADWLGQVLIAPAQIPAGTLAAIVGALYFLALLLKARLCHGATR